MLYEVITADEECAERVDLVGTRANGHQPGQRAVVDEAGVVLRQQQGHQHAADHGEQSYNFV